MGVFISALGLFLLSSFIVDQKIKEIGIRKVMGSSIFSIVVILIKSFLKWVLIANLIALPIAYIIMTLAFQNFALHFDVSIWIFFAVAFFSLLLALITVSYQTIRAAVANPVEALKYE